MDERPKLNKEILIKDFQEFYWLKEELVQFCRNYGLKTSGGKREIEKRIIKYIETGEITDKKEKHKIKVKSKFDWNNSILTLDTLITDNYKNTENVRTFFQQIIGKKFKFNVKFMNWMKTSNGKTLRDAVSEWNRIKNLKSDGPKEIAPQFEYNTYLRDFLADNPRSKREIGIKLWRIKKSLRGNNLYKKEDLKLIEQLNNEV
jgi:hypothetical protein